MKDCGKKMAAPVDETPKLKKSVLSSQLAGGPHGLGDPDDKSLRKIERDVLIANKVRERSRKEKCHKEVQEFVACGKEAKITLPFTCKEQNQKLIKCLEHWFYDPQLNEECKQEYLKERSEFRRTGIGVKNTKRLS